MKMKPEHFQDLEDVVSTLDQPSVREEYREGRFPRADRVTDLDMRYRWDLFHAACKLTEDGELLGYRLRDALYEYLRGDHIDTALRRIVRPLYAPERGGG